MSDVTGLDWTGLDSSRSSCQCDSWKVFLRHAVILFKLRRRRLFALTSNRSFQCNTPMESHKRSRGNYVQTKKVVVPCDICQNLIRSTYTSITFLATVLRYSSIASPSLFLLITKKIDSSSGTWHSLDTSIVVFECFVPTRRKRKQTSSLSVLLLVFARLSVGFCCLEQCLSVDDFFPGLIDMPFLVSQNIVAFALGGFALRNFPIVVPFYVPNLTFL